MIYYKHYMGDYQRHTGHLSLAQDGAYRRMMDHYYSTEQPLPAQPDVLYRICGAMEKAERQAVDYIAKTFFEERNGLLHHQRIDEEVSIAQEKIANLKENAKAGGKQSGQKRASKNEANASPNAEAKGQAETNISHKSVVSTKSNDLENLSLPAWLAPEIWQAWVDYRRGIKARLTLKAAELCIDKLEKLRSEGNDPQAVIEQSIMSGKWTGLFEVKTQTKKPTAAPSKFDPVAHVNRNRITQ
jgi:uncharacterized protein YdaU (DUF1376 family)